MGKKGLKPNHFKSFETPHWNAPKYKKFEEAVNEEPCRGGYKDAFQKAANEIIKDNRHPLVVLAKENIESLTEEYGSVFNVPVGHFQEASNRTGYEIGLILTVYNTIWEEQQKKKVRLKIASAR